LVAAVVLTLSGLGLFKLLSPDQGPANTAVVERCTARTSAGVASLAPDQAANAALIAAVGQARGMSPRAVTIALATAMQESKLRNLDYGDRDSLGLFQQRPSQDWGTPEQIMDPIYSAGEFYAELAKIPGFEDMPITDAAQAVQRSAFPDAYAQHESAARSFASSLTGHSAEALTCQLRPAQAGDPAEFRAALQTEWGDLVAGQVSSQAAAGDAADGTTFRILTEEPVQAWAYASWAVAKAGELGIETVAVGSRTWDRASGQWTAATHLDETGAEQVLVTLK
jgi:hypothetical protein